MLDERIEETVRTLENPDMTEPLFDFLEEHCGQPTVNMVASFWPDNVQESELAIEGLAPNTPILMMDYVAYNDEEIPIFHSLQAYIGKRMKFNLIRRRDGTEGR